MGERMPVSMGGSSRDGHEARYYLASGFLTQGDTVLDAACGIGYGAPILLRTPGVKYVGVDYNLSELCVKPTERSSFTQADLQKWKPGFEFDVAISFETIEHLPDYLPLISTLQRAKKWIISSVPTVPTKHFNPWHKHDFKPGELPTKIVSSEWRLFQKLGQPSELSEIYIFKRK